MASGTMTDSPCSSTQLKSLPSSSKNKTTRPKQYTVGFAKQVAKKLLNGLAKICVISAVIQSFCRVDMGYSFCVCRHEWDSH